MLYCSYNTQRRQAMKCCNYDTRQFFLCGMRFFFGLWLLYAGMSKWIFMGPDAFVGYITSQFDPTWSPHILNMALAWFIIAAEPILAIFILSGQRPRMAWMLTTLLMFLLLMGQTLIKSPNMIANWQYLVLTLVCASLCDPEESCCST